MAYRVTIHGVQSVLHLNQCRHGHVWSWTLAPFLRSAGGCEWLDRLQKCFGEMSVNFKLELNKVGFSNIHTDENLKDWGRGERGGCTSKTVCWHILTWTHFLSWLGEMIPEVISSILNTPCITQTYFEDEGRRCLVNTGNHFWENSLCYCRRSQSNFLTAELNSNLDIYLFLVKTLSEL
jgi:hypothetical protein